MTQDRAGQVDHIVDRGREAPIEHGARPNCQHERLARPWAGPPSDLGPHLGQPVVGSAAAHQLEDRIDHAFAHRNPAHQPLGLHQLLGGHHRHRLHLVRPGGRDQHLPLRLKIRIVHVDLHEKAVELGFRQRIDALLLQWVLGRQHVERPRQLVILPGHRDPSLLHGLQKRRLGPRARPVDLVGHQELAEHGTGDEAERAAPVLVLLQDLGA